MDEDLKKEIIEAFNILRSDALMAIDGSWDCCTDEGKEGFTHQITLIERVLEKLEKIL